MVVLGYTLLVHAAPSRCCVCYLFPTCVGILGCMLLGSTIDLTYPPVLILPRLESLYSPCWWLRGKFPLSSGLLALGAVSYVLTRRLAAPLPAIDFTEVSCKLSHVGSI